MAKHDTAADSVPVAAADSCMQLDDAPPGCQRRLARRGGFSTCLVATLLIVHAAILGWEGAADSVTLDEVGHFAAGLSHWQTGSFCLYSVNPPLVRLIACAPIAVSARNVNLYGYESIPTRVVRGEFAAGKIVANTMGRSYFDRLAVGRWMCIPFSLLGGWVCYRWATELWDRSSGLMALTLWAFSPSVLAYGHLITPDMGTAGLGVAAAYLLRRWLLRPTLPAVVATGFVLGLTQLTKTTWLILMPLWPAIWVLFRLLQPARPSPRQWTAQALQLATMWIIALWILNLLYGFEGSFKPLREHRFVSQALNGPRTPEQQRTAPRWQNRFANSWLGALPVPVPENYLAGIDFVKMEYERKYWSYLRGEWRFGGWWYYYLYAMLIKEPLGTWMLVALATGAALGWRRCYAAPLREELLLLLPLVVVLGLVSSQTGFNHHLRYVLPVFPFLFILISRLGRAFELGHRSLAVVICLALGWSIISSLSVVPHSMSYFNELAGGPKKGHWHLGNSNADWGQDLLYLKKWYDRTPQARPLYLAYDLPLIDPAMLGIDWRELPYGPTWDRAKTRKPEELGPLPGWFAVSVNELHTGNQHKYDYFHDLEPVAWVGYTLPIYHITLDQANALRRKYCMPELSTTAAAGPASMPTTREVHHVRADDSKAHQAKP